ncbi:PREDICTED: glutamate-rich protein 3 [Miniopterus natalensis]|uniref:glutamate-rich protein 3 n=1 Tax=Miniopterus natalensis TaxID=291302 RepID=UPI0007A6F07B|nr:PREDICTED: glutamate-rich protein 3 [Miniopterus natalensis]
MKKVGWKGSDRPRCGSDTGAAIACEGGLLVRTSTAFMWTWWECLYGRQPVCSGCCNNTIHWAAQTSEAYFSQFWWLEHSRLRLLAAYNSLTDKHLAGYFNNTRIRRHLLRSGLITRSGRILSEKEYKLNIMKRDHQKYIRECLAQAIFHKVLDMERSHQLEIKKKLETLARKERIQRFKGEPIRWSLEKNMPVLSPHPPVGPKTNRGHSVLADEGRSSPITLTAPRPYTAPGITQPPIRLQPLPSNPAVRTVPKITPGSRSKTSPLENEAPFPIGGKKALMKYRNSMDNSQGMNQYHLLNVNNYTVPIPPPSPPPNGKITRGNRPETWRRRRFRPTTAPNGLEPAFTRDSRRINKTPPHSNAVITMIYLGKNVHLSYNYPDFGDEIKVYQQHCGGENLCVYKGKLLEKETFQFISKRHHGFPFSLTFFLNGMQVNRLSSCCEYKHRKGSRLGGKGGYFGFVCVERSSPCYKCIIAMGLDKKPTSPKLRKQKSVETREELKKGEGKLRKDRAYVIPRRNRMEGSKTSASVFFSAEEEGTGVEEVRTAVEEMERKGKQQAWEDGREDILQYEYEEDFEADEEKRDERANKEGRADGRTDEMAQSPSDGDKDHVGPGEKSEASSQQAPGAGGGGNGQGEGCSESELEDDTQDIKTESSSSSRSHPYSSCSEDESAPGDREARAGNSADESARSSSSQELSESDEPGKSHLPIKDSLKIEIEDQDIIKADVETKPLQVEESLENVLEEETKKGTQVIAEGLPEKPREHVSKEEKENYRNNLWEGSTAKVKDRKAGLYRVEKGVGQISGGAVEPGCHCPRDAEPGGSSTDEGEKLLTEPGIGTGAAPSRSLAVGESTALDPNKESKPASWKAYTREKEAAVREDEGPQHRDPGTAEEKGGVALWGKVGAPVVPLGEWTPTAEQPAFVERFAEERETPQGVATWAEAEAEAEAEAGGDRELQGGGLHPTGKGAARASGGLSGEAPGQRALLRTAPETEAAAPEGEQGSEEAACAGKAAALRSACARGAAALREAVMPQEGEARSGAGSEKPDAEASEEEASVGPADRGPEEDTAPEGGDGSAGAALGREEAAGAGKAGGRAATPPRPAPAKAGTAPGAAAREGLRGLGEEGGGGEEAGAEAEPSPEGARRETFPEALDTTGGRAEAERPTAPPWEAGSGRGEVTRAKAPRGEALLEEEQKFKGEEGETQGPPGELECDGESAAPTEPSARAEGTGPPGAGALGERAVALSEAAPGFEKPVRKEEGGETLREAGGTGLTGRGQPPCGENWENPAPSEQGDGPGPGAEGVGGAPESDPAGEPQAAEATTRAAGQAQERAAEGQDGLAGLGRKGEEGPLQGQQGAGATAPTQGGLFEGDSTTAAKLSEEPVAEAPEGEADQECPLGAGVTKDGHPEGDGSLQGGVVVAREDLQEGAAGMAPEKRDALAGLKTAEGKTAASTDPSFSGAAGEGAWRGVHELPGNAAAAEGVQAEEAALSQEEVPLTGASGAEARARGEPSDPGGKAPHPGPGRKGGDADASQRAELRGQEAGMGSCWGSSEAGKAEGFRLGLTQETEPSVDSPQGVAILPGEADCPGTQEKQEHTVQRESEHADVSLNNKKA